MLRSLSVAQFLELEVWYALQPRGEARMDIHAARLLHMFFNMNVSQKDRKPIEEFMLKYEEDEAPQPKQSNEDKLWILKLMAMGVGDVKTRN